MKNLEYFYNVIYYFFYRGAIKVLHFIRFLSSPLIIFLFFISKFFSATQKIYDKKGIKNPKAYYKQKMKKVDENPKVSLATMIGGGFTIFILMFFYIGIYNIIKDISFPTFEDDFLYMLIVFGILAFLTDVIFSQINDKGEKYIKEFNKKKGWWRIKWSIITILSPFVAFWFSFTTSDGGDINRYLLSLSGNYTYPTAQEKLEYKKAMELFKVHGIKSIENK